MVYSFEEHLERKKQLQSRLSGAHHLAQPIKTLSHWKKHLKMNREIKSRTKALKNKKD
jgi:hypothetical protein